MPLADFPSQYSVITLLQRSIQQGRLGHAYLLAGNDLGELEAVGLALGQALNCVEPTEIAPDGTPLDACGQCLSWCCDRNPSYAKCASAKSSGARTARRGCWQTW